MCSNENFVSYFEMDRFPAVVVTLSPLFGFGMLDFVGHGEFVGDIIMYPRRVFYGLVDGTVPRSFKKYFFNALIMGSLKLLNTQCES